MTVATNTKSNRGAIKCGVNQSIANADGESDRGALRSFGYRVLSAYTYGLLDPRAGATGENLSLLGTNTLGIEVTVPELARRCGRGNVDPQHGGGTDDSMEGTAAIEACLNVTPPPTGSILVTGRPDLDAFGAMALLALRHGGHASCPEMRARIDRIARADCFDHGQWPGPRALPRTSGEFAEIMHQDIDLVAIAGATLDSKLNASERVGLAADWMVTGTEPLGYRQRWTMHAQVLLDGLVNGAVAVEAKAGGRIVLVNSRLAGSLRLGYCRAPVAVACNPGAIDAYPPAPRRVVVAQQAPGYVDFAKVRDTLVWLEPGWGGSNTILGSPQGRACGLEIEVIVDAVAQQLA